MKIEWERFPKATHFTMSASGYCDYWQIEGGKILRQWSQIGTGGDFGQIPRKHIRLNPFSMPVMHERPAVEQWDGEGLPYAGVRCEYSLTNGGVWHECVIKYVLATGKQLVAECSGNPTDKESVLHVNTCLFRKLRTAEQIAAEAREKAVAAMLELDPYLPNTTLGMMSRKDFCGALYDANYRKQVDV